MSILHNVSSLHGNAPSQLTSFKISAAHLDPWTRSRALQVLGRAGGCIDGVRVGLDLDGLVAAGGADEPADRPSGLRFAPAADGQGGEHDGQVCRLRSVAFVVVDGPSLQSCLDMRKDFRSDFSIWKSWWQAPIATLR